MKNLILIFLITLFVGGAAQAKSGVYTRPDGFLDVDGKPTLPIGIYAVPFDTDNNTLMEMKNAGINLVYPGPIPMRNYCFGGKWMIPDKPNPEPSRSEDVDEYLAAVKSFLDKADAVGLKVFISPMKFDFYMDYLIYSPDERISRKEMIKKSVLALKDHPALALWSTVTEPEISVCTDDDILATYKLVKSIDTGHPIWTFNSPVIHSREILSSYNRAADVTGGCVYPVPVGVGHSYLDNQELSCVGEYTDRAVSSALKGQPVWMVLQMFSWKNMPGSRMPYYDELRFMTFDALVHGAKGVIYWHFRDGFADKSLWKDYLKLTREVSDLSPALMGTPVNEKVTSTPGVKWISRKYDGRVYVFAVNDSNDAVKAVWKFKHSVKELASGQDYQSGSFEDTLEKYGVRVYSYKD